MTAIEVSINGSKGPPMNVVVALNTFEDDGPGLLCLGMARHWATVPGLRVRAVALSRGGVLQERWRALGIETDVVPSRGLFGLRQLHDWSRDLHASRATRPQVVNTHLLWPDLAMRWMMGDLGKPVLVSTSHGLHALDEKGWLSGAVYRRLEAATRHEVDAWIGVSAGVARDLRGWGIAKSQIHVITNGIAPDDFPVITAEERAAARARYHLEEGAFAIGAVGNLRAVKGHDVLLKAFARVARHHAGVRLLIAGDGPERAALGALAARLGVADRIHWLGHLAGGPGRLLAALDVLAHASRAESFGLAVAEAQARGLPAVVTRVGGLPEVVADGTTGLVVAAEQPVALARALGRLAADPALGARLGAAGARRVRERFDIAVSARRYVALWRALCQRQTTNDPSF